MFRINNAKNIAVLIDADNISPEIIDTLLAEISKYGLICTKKIYGDWM